MDSILTMAYSQYKKHYSDCTTVKGSYDEHTKTIKVVIPEGRMKKSGVRGNHFSAYHLYFKNKNGEVGYFVYRAIDLEHAMKQHLKECKLSGYTPCECPDKHKQTIFR